MDTCTASFVLHGFDKRSIFPPRSTWTGEVLALVGGPTPRLSLRSELRLVSDDLVRFPIQAKQKLLAVAANRVKRIVLDHDPYP